MSEQRFTDADGDSYHVEVIRHMSRDCISILLNGIDEVVFRITDAELIAKMIVTAAKEGK